MLQKDDERARSRELGQLRQQLVVRAIILELVVVHPIALLGAVAMATGLTMKRKVELRIRKLGM